MKWGDMIEAAVEGVASEGKGVARVGDFVVFVRGGIPGDVVRMMITGRKKSFAEADVVEILTPSPARQRPQCRYFGVCGGCTWQHVAYHAQCEYKRTRVVDALERIGGFRGVVVQPTLGAESPFYYRNKMEFSFGDRWLTREEMEKRGEGGDAERSGNRFALGLHIPQRYDKVLDLEICWLQSETSARIVNDVRAFCLENDIPVYSPALHTGYMRNLVIREGHVTGERMVNVVTRDDRPDIMRSLTERLVAAFPSITTVVNNITAKKSQVAVGETETVYHGPGSITEKIGKRLYRISANSFFQTNTAQAERLYETAHVMAKLRPDDVVFDLYSGTGTIALHVADEVRHVVGIEAVASAVEDAKRNAVSNGVQNCTFLLGDLKDTLLGSRLQGTPLPHPDVILVDPPRAGMHEKVVREIRRLAPRRIVYVSCNPSTQARDMKVLCEENAYAVDEVRPVDMFPHTYHIESVASLSRTSPSA